MRGTRQHLLFARDSQAPHRDHDVFLGGEILEEKMKLKNKPQELVPFSVERVVVQVRNDFVFDRDAAPVRLVEQTEDVKESVLAAARRPHDRVHGSALELERDAAQSMNSRILLPQEAFDALTAERDFGVHSCSG